MPKIRLILQNRRGAVIGYGRLELPALKKNEEVDLQLRFDVVDIELTGMTVQPCS